MNLNKRNVTSMALFLGGCQININRARALAKAGLVVREDSGRWVVPEEIASAFVARYGRAGEVIHRERGERVYEKGSSYRVAVDPVVQGAPVQTDPKLDLEAAFRRIQQSSARARVWREKAKAAARLADGGAAPAAGAAGDQGAEVLAVPPAGEPGVHPGDGAGQVEAGLTEEEAGPAGPPVGGWFLARWWV